MSILTFPTLSRAAPGEMDWSLVSNTQTHESPLSKSVQTLALPGARWQVVCSFVNLTVADAAQLEAFLVALRGMAGRCYLHRWDRARPRGVASGTPLVKGAGQTGASLLTDGWTPSTAGILKAGDMLGVNGELKMVVADAASDAGGNATLAIEPPLRAAPADNAPLVLTRPTAVFGLTEDTSAWSVRPALRSSFQLQFIERF